MSDIESAFLAEAAGGCPAARAAYHDWLLERGRTADAAAGVAATAARVEKFADLKGLVLAAVDELPRPGQVRDELRFTLADGRCFRLYHQQDCCESVTIEDVCGDLRDLVGSPILLAEEATSGENPEGVTKEWQDSFTWTFYRLATVKGYVTIRWYGESNGYYSESVDFGEVEA